jgi:hypothetical protein
VPAGLPQLPLSPPPPHVGKALHPPAEATSLSPGSPPEHNAPTAEGVHGVGVAAVVHHRAQGEDADSHRLQLIITATRVAKRHRWSDQGCWQLGKVPQVAHSYMRHVMVCHSRPGMPPT